MSPRRQTVDPAQGILHVEWPLFGELSRALALKVSREYDPDIVVGIATAGVVPGAVIAAMLRREFHSDHHQPEIPRRRDQGDARGFQRCSLGRPRKARADRG